MKKFRCSECNNEFEAKGKKVSWKSRIYGPSWKYVAKCPKCGEEVDEYVPVSVSRKSGGSNVGSACATGTCPFVS